MQVTFEAPWYATFVLKLLEGEEMFIKPEGFDQIRSRGAQEHRLNKDGSKWVPFHAQDRPEPAPAVEPEKAD